LTNVQIRPDFTRMRLKILFSIVCGLAFPSFAAEMPVSEIGARAAAGDSKAMVSLGLAYRDAGLPAVAAEWFCRAAASDEPEGHFWCGRSLTLGFGRQADARQGQVHLERAANSGSAAAALLLGRRTAGPDAERWFETAGRLGSAEGDFRLGLLLDRQGRGAAAIEAYSRAAELGYAPAFNALGLARLNGGTDAREAAILAKSAFIRGAELGDQASQLNAGMQMSEADPAAAFRYLSLAMTGPNAQIRLLAAQSQARTAARLGISEVERLEQTIAPEIEASRSAARHRKGVQD